MKKELFSRKYKGEEYTYMQHCFKPGEIGILGILQRDYFMCETPDNGLGYTDTVLLHKDSYTGDYTAYTLHRYLQPWILKKIKIMMIKLTEQEGLLV